MFCPRILVACLVRLPFTGLEATLAGCECCVVRILAFIGGQNRWNGVVVHETCRHSWNSCVVRRWDPKVLDLRPEGTVSGGGVIAKRNISVGEVSSRTNSTLILQPSTLNPQTSILDPRLSFLQPSKTTKNQNVDPDFASSSS